MKVILKQDVHGVGKSGAIAEVADGYGRNFLLPKGLAEEANAGNMAQLAGRKAAHDKRNDKQLASAKELAALLERDPVTVTAKAGDQGRLFGAVTNAQIADAIKKALGIEVDRHKIDLKEPIKAVGDYGCTIKLTMGISARVRVHVSAA